MLEVGGVGGQLQQLQRRSCRSWRSWWPTPATPATELPELPELAADSSNSSVDGVGGVGGQLQQLQRRVAGVGGVGGQLQQLQRPRNCRNWWPTPAASTERRIAGFSGQIRRCRSGVWGWVTTAETSLSNCIQVFEKTLLTLAYGTMQSFGLKPSKSWRTSCGADDEQRMSKACWLEGPDPRKSKQISKNQKLGKHMVWKLSTGLLKNIAAFFHDPGSLALALHAVPVQLHWARCLSHVCDSLLGADLFRPAAASNWEVKSWKFKLLETVEPKNSEFKLSISYLKVVWHVM